jgi:hypothetical protein
LRRVARRAICVGAALEMKKPLTKNRINGFRIWLRGQDLNL